MLSRVASSIYWMNRYVERAENVARFIDVSSHLLLDLPDWFNEQWAALVRITGDYEDFQTRYPEASREAVIEFLAFDRANPNSIISCVHAARENARTTREILSSETWEAINEFYLNMQSAVGKKNRPYDFFRSVRQAGHLIEGAQAETMSRGEAWHFGRMGRMLERADKTTRILDIKYFLLLPNVRDVGRPIDDLQWGAVLRSASAFEMYRKEFGRIAADDIVRFLVLDPEFPRSVRFCLHEAERALHAVSGSPERRFQNNAERILGRLVAGLDYTDEDEIVETGLHEFLDQTQDQINSIGNAIYETFFALKRIARSEPGGRQLRRGAYT